MPFFLTAQQTYPTQSTPAVIELERVGLDIPVMTTETRSLKASLIRSVTGRLRHEGSGAVVTALRDLHSTGGHVGLIGHNGAGKSTFLRLISGIYRTPLVSLGPRSCISDDPQELCNKSRAQWFPGIKAYLLSHSHLRGFDAFLDDVIEFSGLGDFIHLPVKTQSGYVCAFYLRFLLVAIMNVWLWMKVSERVTTLL